MKPCLLTLTIIAGCTAFGAPAFAQSALQPGGAAAQGSAGAARSPAVVTAASSDARALVRTPGKTVITAAGSLIILSDGIVANATMAQILPPAPGFVYER